MNLKKSRHLTLKKYIRNYIRNNRRKIYKKSKYIVWQAQISISFASRFVWIVLKPYVLLCSEENETKRMNQSKTTYWYYFRVSLFIRISTLWIIFLFQCLHNIGHSVLMEVISDHEYIKSYISGFRNCNVLINKTFYYDCNTKKSVINWLNYWLDMTRLFKSAVDVHKYNSKLFMVH